jgi:hypothetical protein
MKKLILTLVLIVGTVLGVDAQNSQSDCPDNSTFIKSSCDKGCYSIVIHTSLSPVKPTISQAIAIKEDLDKRCNTFNGTINIEDPGTITN